MVEYVLAKDEIGVRFPVLAQKNAQAILTTEASKTVCLRRQEASLYSQNVFYAITTQICSFLYSYSIKIRLKSLKTVDKSVDMCIKDSLFCL